MTETAQSDRLFFAVWPDTATGKLLEKAGKDLHGICHGKLTRLDTIHITLAFLGEVETSRLTELLSIANEVKAASFGLDIIQFGYWKHNHIVWAGPETTPEAMAGLVHDLTEKLKAAGFKLDSRKYVPHVTLLRKAECSRKMPEIKEIPWKVSEFVLVKSVPGKEGSIYEAVGRWPLL